MWSIIVQCTYTKKNLARLCGQEPNKKPAHPGPCVAPDEFSTRSLNLRAPSVPLCFCVTFAFVDTEQTAIKAESVTSRRGARGVFALGGKRTKWRPTAKCESHVCQANKYGGGATSRACILRNSTQ